MKPLFENAHFIAVHKQAGYLTVPSRMGEKDERPCLGIELQKSLGQQIWPIHRLDFEVSGVVLFAKSEVAHKFANQAFETRSVQKFYEALTTGEAPKANTVYKWRSKLLRGKKRSYEHAVGKEALTEAKFLGPIDGQLHWLLIPYTGRPHQLRVHLAKAGYPIVGDKLYGSEITFSEPGIALRSVELNFKNCEDLREFGLPEKITTNGF